VELQRLAMLTVLLGSLTAGLQAGTFRFDGPRALQLGYAPKAVRLVDLDHDRDLDLVVVNRGWFTDDQWIGSSVEIFLNPGDGYFEASTVYATPAAPQDLAVCDVDGDGNLDLITPNAAPDNLSVCWETATAASRPER